MIININTLISNIPTSSLEDTLKANCLRYLNLLRLEKCKEYQKWDQYIKNHFHTSLYKALYKLISYITLTYNEDGYSINTNRVVISDNLNSDQLANLIIYGNLSIKKSYLFNNMIDYAIKYL